MTGRRRDTSTARSRLDADIRSARLNDSDRHHRSPPYTASRPWPGLHQVYLIERDTGLLCRILGLYAARGIDVLHAEYAHAAQDVMTLKVRVAGHGPEAEEMRVLVEKARSLIGVIAAAEQETAMQRAAQKRAAPSCTGEHQKRSSRCARTPSPS